MMPHDTRFDAATGPDSASVSGGAVAPAPVPPGPVVLLDVRDDLRTGREPFSRIMAAVDALRPDEVLHLRATFEPLPLFRVLARRGLDHVSHEHAPDDWSVWFHRATTAAGAAGDASAAGAAAHERAAGAAVEAAHAPVADTSVAQEIVLDVRGLEPPEPMVRTLAALESLPADAVLVQRNDRVPQFLLPLLAERGFRYEVDDGASDAVVVRIRRAS